MYPFVVTIVYPVRTAASQAVKTGSNPVGDANLNEALAVSVSAFFYIMLIRRRSGTCMLGWGSMIFRSQKKLHDASTILVLQIKKFPFTIHFDLLVAV